MPAQAATLSKDSPRMRGVPFENAEDTERGARWTHRPEGWLGPAGPPLRAPHTRRLCRSAPWCHFLSRTMEPANLPDLESGDARGSTGVRDFFSLPDDVKVAWPPVKRFVVVRVHVGEPSLDGRVSQCTRLKPGRSRCDSESSGRFRRRSSGGREAADPCEVFDSVSSGLPAAATCLAIFRKRKRL